MWTVWYVCDPVDKPLNIFQVEPKCLRKPQVNNRLKKLKASYFCREIRNERKQQVVADFSFVSVVCKM